MPELKKCSACGLCLPVCPVFARTGLEPDGPRGKMLVALNFAQGNLDTQSAVRYISRCLACGKCERRCPAHLPILAIFMACRQIMAKYLPVSRKRRIFFRMLICSPKVRDFLQPPVYLLGKLLKQRHFLHDMIPFKPFNGINADERQKTPAPTRVLLFTGCLARSLFPDLASACVQVLQAAGAEALAPPGLACCGRPLALQGNIKALRSAVRRNLASLEGQKFDWLVTPCPGCLATIVNIWPEAVAESKSKIADLARQCLDINSFLERYGNMPVPAKKFFWHEPCLMSAEASHAARKMLGNRVTAQTASSCCGAPLERLDQKRIPGDDKEYMSTFLARSVCSNAVDVDAIATGCPGCMLALRRHTALPVRHSVEILAEGLMKK